MTRSQGLAAAGDPSRYRCRLPLHQDGDPPVRRGQRIGRQQRIAVGVADDRLDPCLGQPAIDQQPPGRVRPFRRQFPVGAVGAGKRRGVGMPGDRDRLAAASSAPARPSAAAASPGRSASDDPVGNIGSLTSSRIWMRRPSGVMSMASCLARSASAGSPRTASLICCGGLFERRFFLARLLGGESAAVTVRVSGWPSRTDVGRAAGAGCRLAALLPEGLFAGYVVGVLIVGHRPAPRPSPDLARWVSV